jgi:hypothetical protein
VIVPATRRTRVPVFSNVTCYDTVKIRSIVTKIHRRLSRTEGGPLPKWKTMKVLIRYDSYKGRGKGYYSGWAWPEHENQIQINLPRKSALTRMTAILIEHELLHMFDYDHDDMGELDWDWKAIENEYNWAVKITKGEFLPIVASHL